MQIRTGVYWSVGARCGKNQDSLSLQHVMLRKGECLLAVVCDGIGSLAQSEEASGYVVRSMTDWFYHEGKELIYRNRSKEIVLLALQRRFIQIQEHLKTFQQSQNIQTGTTCSGILIVRNRYYLMHIGDSRIYRIRNSKVPFCRRKYRAEHMTEDDRDASGFLLKCLGMRGQDRVILESGRIKRRTGFLLCTDGFYDGNEDDRIGQVLGPLLEAAGRRRGLQAADKDADRRLELLGEQAQRSGSRDNMAAIGIFVHGRC